MNETNWVLAHSIIRTHPHSTPAQLFSCSPVDGRGRGTDMDGQWADGRGTDMDGLGTGVDGRGRGTDVDRRGRTGRTWTDGRGRGWTAYFDSRWVSCQARHPSTPMVRILHVRPFIK